MLPQIEDDQPSRRAVSATHLILDRFFAIRFFLYGGSQSVMDSVHMSGNILMSFRSPFKAKRESSPDRG